MSVKNVEKLNIDGLKYEKKIEYIAKIHDKTMQVQSISQNTYDLLKESEKTSKNSPTKIMANISRGKNLWLSVSQKELDMLLKSSLNNAVGEIENLIDDLNDLIYGLKEKM